MHGGPNVWATPYHTAESLGAGTPPAAPLSGGGDAPAGGPRRAGPGRARRPERKNAHFVHEIAMRAQRWPRKQHTRCGFVPIVHGSVVAVMGASTGASSPINQGPWRTDVG